VFFIAGYQKYQFDTLFFYFEKYKISSISIIFFQKIRFGENIGEKSSDCLVFS